MLKVNRGRSKKAVRTKSQDEENDQRPSVLSSKKRKRRHLFDKVDDPKDDDYDPNEDELRPRKRSTASRKSSLPLSASSVALTAMQQAKAKVKPKRATKEPALMSLMPQGYEPWAKRTRAGKKQISAAAGSASALIQSDDKDDNSARETEQSNPNASAKSTPEADKSSDNNPPDETDKSNEDGSAKSITDKSNENGSAKSTTDKSNEDGSAKSITDKSNENGSAKSTADKSNETNGENEAQPGVLQVQVHGLKKTVAKERVHKCGNCPQVFKHVKDLNEHSRTDHSDKPFECSKCQKKYSSTNALARHEKRHEGFGFKCGQCNFVCQFRYELRDHLKKHSDSQKWPCERGGCGLQFSTKRGMRQHMQVHSDNKYPCTYCPKVFETPGYLRQHTYYHTGGFPCYCGHKAKNPTARNIHQKQCDSCKDKKNVKVLLDDFKESSTLAELNESSSSSGESPSSGTEDA